jgi:hypothetical protein
MRDAVRGGGGRCSALGSAADAICDDKQNSVFKQPPLKHIGVNLAFSDGLSMRDFPLQPLPKPTKRQSDNHKHCQQTS